MDTITIENLLHHIKDLTDIIQVMSEKIDNIENKIDEINVRGTGTGGRCGGSTTVSVRPDFIPDITFQKWIQDFEIGKHDVMLLLENNIMYGFKCCLHKLIMGVNMGGGGENLNPIWIHVHGRYKQIYIYDLVDDDSLAQWHTVTEDDMYILVDTIWRKMIEYYFIIEEESLEILTDDELTCRDLNKRVLLDSKRRLLKHTKEIQRYIIEYCLG